LGLNAGAEVFGQPGVQRLQAASAQEVQEERDVVHAHRHAKPGHLDHEAADGSGACEVVEHLETECQLAPPLLAGLDHLPIANAIRQFERRASSRV
jgi:hypothetical protein